MTNYSINGGSFVGCQLGDTIYKFTEGKKYISRNDIQLAEYYKYLREKYKLHYLHYTPLDVTPTVSILGESVRASTHERFPVHTLLGKHQRLFVLGTSGSGKSALLKYLLYQNAISGQRAAKPENFTKSSDHPETIERASEICAYAELGQFKLLPGLSPLQSLAWLIGQTFFDSGALVGMPSIDGCLALLRIDGMVVLLDGLNEISDPLRADCLAAIENLAQLSPQLRLIVTSRPHQVAPPAGWISVLLSEMTDDQVEEFLTRYLGETNSQQMLQLIFKAPIPLLRVPLYLYFVTELYSSGVSDIRGQLASRAAMIDAYVQHLLRRDSIGKAAPMFSRAQLAAATRVLAREHHEMGTSLPLNQAQRVIAGIADGSEHDRGSLLNYLSELGILRIDGRYVRFWHQTIQDYFFAGEVAERWKGPQKKAPRPPRWLRALLRDPLAEDSLVCLPVHLIDQELAKVLAVVTDANPQLAIYWLDDLQAERRVPAATQKLLQRFKQRVSSGVRYSRLYSNGMTDFCQSAAMFCLVLLVSLITYILVIIIPKYLLSYDLFPESETLSRVDLHFKLFQIFYAAIAIAAALSVVFIYSHWRIYMIDFNKDKLRRFLNTLLYIQNPEIKAAIDPLLEYVKKSWFARMEIKALANIIQSCLRGENPLSLFKRDEYLFVKIAAIGHIRGNRFLDCLMQILKMDNVYSYAAARAMLIRATRFSEEREAICDLSWNYWNNQTLDWRVRSVARRILLICGCTPGGRSEVIKRAVFSSIKISLFISATTTFAGTAMEIMGIKSGAIIGFLVATAVSRDASKRGAKNIVGYFGADGYGLGFWRSSSALVSPMALLYYLVRNRIQRNSLGIPAHLYGEAK